MDLCLGENHALNPAGEPGASGDVRTTPRSGEAAAGSMTGRSFGDYELLEEIGRGGMGEVWVAFDETLERRVALKSVRRERRLDEEARARFLREARILSQLQHPRICQIHAQTVIGLRAYIQRMRSR